MTSVPRGLPGQVSPPFQRPCAVEYRGDPDFFSSPAVMWNGSKISLEPDSFTFQAGPSPPHVIYLSPLL